MENHIRIKAQPKADPNLCDFILENAIEPYGAYTFHKSENTDSPLAQSLFAVDGLEKFTVVGSTITVQKQSDKPWPMIGKDIGTAIREALSQNETLIPEAKKQRNPEEQERIKKVMKIIQDKINPQVASHGGFIELIDVNDKDLFIRMGGGCQGCAASTATLKQGVEQTLREEITDLGQVIDTTDHNAGSNPYFK